MAETERNNSNRNVVFYGSGETNNQKRKTNNPLYRQSLEQQWETYSKVPNNKRMKEAYVWDVIIKPIIADGGRFYNGNGVLIDESVDESRRFLLTKVSQALRDYKKKVTNTKPKQKSSMKRKATVEIEGNVGIDGAYENALLCTTSKKITQLQDDIRFLKDDYREKDPVPINTFAPNTTTFPDEGKKEATKQVREYSNVDTNPAPKKTPRKLDIIISQDYIQQNQLDSIEAIQESFNKEEEEIIRECNSVIVHKQLQKQQYIHNDKVNEFNTTHFIELFATDLTITTPNENELLLHRTQDGIFVKSNQTISVDKHSTADVGPTKDTLSEVNHVVVFKCNTQQDQTTTNVKPRKLTVTHQQCQEGGQMNENKETTKAADISFKTLEEGIVTLQTLKEIDFEKIHYQQTTNQISNLQEKILIRGTQEAPILIDIIASDDGTCEVLTDSEAIDTVEFLIFALYVICIIGFIRIVIKDVCPAWLNVFHSIVLVILSYIIIQLNQNI